MELIQIKESFLNHYPLLTPMQKRIWLLLLDYSKNYRTVFPSHSKIARACGCHRDTVIQAIKKFISLSWLGVMKRAYKTCVYFISECLLHLNPRRNDIFKKFCQSKPTEYPTNKPTLINKNKYEDKKNDIVSKDDRNVQITDFSSQVSLKGVSKKDLSLLENLTTKDPSAMKKAIDDLKALEEKENVRNVAALIVSRWKYHNSNRDGGEVEHVVKDLPLSQKDKELMSKYCRQDRKAFLYAFEDFKTYGIFRKVRNVAAFLTSRFFAYSKGSVIKIDPKCSFQANKKMALELEKNAVCPKGVRIVALNKYIEFNSGMFCDVIEYVHKSFDYELEKLIKKWGIT